MGRKKGAKTPTIHDQAQAVILAEMAGDAAACERYGITVRSLQRYREQLADEESELSRIVAEYRLALTPQQEQPVAFFSWLQGRVQQASDKFMDKADGINALNPEGLRALNEHMEALLGHVAALSYIERMFAATQGEEQDEA